MKLFYIQATALLFFLSSTTLMGQEKPAADKAVLISPSVSIQFPGGDLGERFGTNFTIGAGAGYKFSNNLILAFNAHYMFGNMVKNPEELLKPILSDNGNVFNTTGNYAEVNIFERGVYGLAELQQVFNGFWSPNSNSGPSIGAGAGYIFHWISYDNLGNDSPQILEDYHKGYDRLSGGFMLKQSIGYTYLAKNRRVNFRLSFEVLEAFTTDLRKYNYSTGSDVTGQRMDLLYGFRLNWYLPIYTKGPNQFYYD